MKWLLLFTIPLTLFAQSDTPCPLKCPTSHTIALGIVVQADSLTADERQDLDEAVLDFKKAAKHWEAIQVYVAARHGMSNFSHGANGCDRQFSIEESSTGTYNSVIKLYRWCPSH